MRLINGVDAFVSRCYLAWRLMRTMRDPLRVAWHKARRV